VKILAKKPGDKEKLKDFKKKENIVASEKKLKEFLNKEVVILTSSRCFVRGFLKQIGKWNIILEPNNQVLLRASVIGIRTVEKIREDFDKKHGLWVLFHGLWGRKAVDFHALAPNAFVAFLYTDDIYHSFYDGNLYIVRAEKLDGERKPVIRIERDDLNS